MIIEEVNAPDAMTALKTDWQNLVNRAEGATIYQTWEWNEAWWREFGNRKRLRVFILKEGSELVCIAPLYVSRHLYTPLRRLAFIGTGASDYLDIITGPGSCTRATKALLHYLDNDLNYDLADLQQLRPGSALLRAACDVDGNTDRNRNQTILPQEPCPYVELPSSWEDFIKQLGKKMRSNLGYYDRLLRKSFSHVEIETITEPELEKSMERLFDLHQKRWNARLLPGVMGSPATRAFHRVIARRFSERDWLKLHVIKIDGNIVSALYCFVFRGRYYYYLGGFAPDLGKYSLGTVLTGHAIKDAIQMGCKEFDFLRGNEPYKYRWRPAERVNHRLLLADRRSTRARLMLKINQLEQNVEHKAKNIAANRGRKQKQ